MKTFYPDKPQHWNRIAWVMKQGGYTHKRTFYWHLKTVCDFKDIGEGINRHCRNLSKSHVETCFKETFGYRSFVPPNERGKKVIKSEQNAVHDGRIVEEPYTLKDGEICQRFIDTGLIEHRPVIVWGEVVCVLVKEKYSTFGNGAKKFSTKPPDILSQSTRERIKNFCGLLGMDYGELDMLKDRKDGRWYIVDANQCPGGGTPEFFAQSEDELAFFVHSHKPLFDE